MEGGRKMKLSVIIITHNNYALKDGCIEAEILSILNQTETDFEIIVVDNCSDKNNFNNLQNFISKLNNCNIKLIKNNINNISKARNLGAKTAISDLLLFMDFLRLDIGQARAGLEIIKPSL